MDSVTYLNDQKESSIMNEEKVKELFNRERNISSKELKRLIEYLVLEESKKLNVSCTVNGLSFIENINREKLSLPLTLVKAAKYIGTAGSCRESNIYNGIIMINTDHYISNTIIYDDYIALFKILKTSFHELQHANQNKLVDDDKPDEMSLNSYINLKEKFVVYYKKIIYLLHHDSFFIEIDANLTSANKVKEIIEKNSDSLLRKMEPKVSKYINSQMNKKNMYDDSFLSDIVDSIVKSNPSLVEHNDLLKMEYNENGKRKNVSEILELRDRKLQPSCELFNHLLFNSLKGTSLDSFRVLLNNINSEDLNLIKSSIDFKMNAISSQRIINTEFVQKRVINNVTWLKNDCHIVNSYCKLADYQKVVNEELLKTCGNKTINDVVGNEAIDDIKLIR